MPVRIRITVKAGSDPGNDMYPKSVALAKADLLVAHDKDSLTLGAYKGACIGTPSEFLRAR